MQTYLYSILYSSFKLFKIRYIIKNKINLPVLVINFSPKAFGCLRLIFVPICSIFFHCFKGVRDVLLFFHCFKGVRDVLLFFHCFKGVRDVLLFFHCFKGVRDVLQNETCAECVETLI